MKVLAAPSPALALGALCSTRAPLSHHDYARDVRGLGRQRRMFQTENRFYVPSVHACDLLNKLCVAAVSQ